MKFGYFILFYLVLAISNSLFSQHDDIVIQKGHSGAIHQAVISKDKKYIVSASADFLIKLWDITTGKEMRTFVGHTADVNSAAITSNNKKIVSGSDDRMIKIWDTETGKELKNLELSGYGVNQVLISADDKYFVASTSNLQIWDLEMGFMIREIEFPEGFNSGSPVVLSEDGKFILGFPLSYGSNITPVWDFKTGKLLASFPKALYSENEVIISRENNYSLTLTNQKFTLKEINTGLESIIPQYFQDKSYSVDYSGYVKWKNAENSFDFYNSSSILVQSFESKASIYSQAEISSDAKLMLTLNNENTLQMLDFSLCKPLYSFEKPNNNEVITSFDISNDNTLGVFATNRGRINLFSAVSGNVIFQYTENQEDIASVVFCPTGEKLAVGTKDKSLLILNLNLKQPQTLTLNKKILFDEEIKKIEFSNNGKFMAVYSSSKIALLDAQTFNIFFTQTQKAAYSLAFSPKDDYLAIGGEGEITVIDIEERDVFLLLLTDKGMDNQQYLGLDHSGRTGAWDKEDASIANTINFSKNGNLIITANNDNTVQVWDWQRGKRSKIYRYHTDNVVFASLTDDNKNIISASTDMTAQIYNTETQSYTAFMSHKNATDWITFNSDGYWDASQYGGDLVAYVKGMSCWNIDQFAITSNRPDLILKNLPFDDKFTAQHFYAQYLKRLKKLGLTEQTIVKEPHTPQCSITNINNKDGKASLSFSFSDSKYNVVSYNIFINNVPIYNGRGKKLIPARKFQLTESVELLKGENKIEISCYNDKGNESIRALAYLNVEQEKQPSLYYLGFGVSLYKNTGYNLDYAAKDIEDMANVFKDMEGNKFEKTFVKTYVNQEVTEENIRKSKEFLANARPEDVFVLHIAGHGMHERTSNADYYFLVHASDTNSLEKSAVRFEAFEELLDGIAPRKKLFLMDACESGEKESDEIYASAQQGQGLKFRGFINPNQNAQSEQVLKSVFQKDRYIYNDLSRRTGSIVFSSSKGGELSAEQSDYQNGLFTEHIINAFTNNAADNNKDGKISIDELRDYVYQNVVKDSNNKQHPTIDRDNIYQRFNF